MLEMLLTSLGGNIIKTNLQRLRAFIIVYIAVVHGMTKVHLIEVICFVNLMCG